MSAQVIVQTANDKDAWIALSGALGGAIILAVTAQLRLGRQLEHEEIRLGKQLEAERARLDSTLSQELRLHDLRELRRALDGGLEVSLIAMNILTAAAANNAERLEERLIAVAEQAMAASARITVLLGREHVLSATYGGLVSGLQASIQTLLQVPGPAELREAAIRAVADHAVRHRDFSDNAARVAGVQLA